jgi:hydroxymethylpyrimidine kinase/phosphomethylpyrimidine kinase
MRVPVALTIAGSDSGGGAGIQADLKAFAALGVHGAVAVTAITAQNTYEVRAVRKIEPELVRAQIRAVVEDMGVDSAKTGMLYDQDIIRVVAEEWRSIAKPLVVDPVMVAKSGARLLKEEAIRALKEELLPLATVATPNVPEAEVLADLKIKDVEDMKEAARRLASLGAKAVVVKGGHLPLASGRLMNVLYLNGETHEHELPYYPVGTTHGSGCAFSAAIAAELAKGRDIEEAVELAGRLTSEAIKRGLSLGKGHGPVNPMAELYAKADELTALEDVKRAVRMLEQLGSGDVLSPESQINVAVALRHAEGPHDIIAIPGRIVNVMGRLRASAWPERGASKHLANYLLVLQRLKPEVRAAVNIKFSKKFVERALALGLQVSSYDRRQEPPSVKAVEGGTTRWGAEQAVASLGAVPDVIYHEGDVGKEPMIVVLGRTAEEAVRRALLIAGLVDAFKA